MSAILTSADYPDITEIETVSGLLYDFVDPTPAMIDWDDVFTGLSQINRFGGHTSPRPYSVGEHVLLVKDLVAAAGGTVEQQLAALHHDSHEVYLGDLPSPLKRLIKRLAPGVWEALVEMCDGCLREKLGLPSGAFEDPLIKRCDTKALRIEAADLKASRGLSEHWGFDCIPAEIAYFQVSQIAPAPGLIRDRLRQAHEQLTGQPTALAA